MAQGTADSLHLGNDCRLAAQILKKGQPDPHRDWALERIASCNESGGEVLAALWATPPAQPELGRLGHSSAAFLDARLLTAVRSAAADRSNPSAVRVAALAVLAAYVDPHVSPTPADLKPPSEGQIAQPIGSVDHRVQTVGAQPLPEGYAAEIVAFLAGLAGDSDTTVRYAAARLHDRLTPG